MPHQSRGEFIPPNLAAAMKVTRLANADWARIRGNQMRYIIICNIHEAIDPDQPIRVLDSLGDCVLTVQDVLHRLPERSRKEALWSVPHLRNL